MATRDWDVNCEARAALDVVVRERGVAGLSDPQLMVSMLRDLIPDAYRESNVLIAAAEADVPGMLRDRLAHHVSVGAAVTQAAAQLEARTALSPDACLWAAQLMAEMIGAPLDATPPSVPESETESAPYLETQTLPPQSQQPVKIPPTPQLPQPRVLQAGQRVNAVAFSPDGTQLAAGGQRRVLIWNLQTGAVVRELRTARFNTVSAVAFSPDGTRLATGGSDQTARIWDVTTGREHLQVTPLRARQAPFSGVMAPVPSSRGMVCAVAFSPDGTRLATGSDDKTARIWDAATGRQRLQVSHRGKVGSVAFSPDGTRLATGSDDKTARIWDIAGR